MSSELPMDGPAISLHSNPSAIAPSGSVAAGGSERALAALDDRALIALAQGGDRAAFEILVHRYDRDVLRLVLRVLHSPEEARDVYQEAFLKIYRNLHRFRLESSFYTWIYRVVTNVCLDHLRRRASRPEDQAPAVTPNNARHAQPPDYFDSRQDRQADPERRLLGQEIGQRIDAALELLSPRERMIFEMKHYQGLKLRAIGEALGTTEETVKNSLFRATRKLREQLQEFH
jgi:RNA polymerase sigma-70 factor (ECF subfamily)